MPFANGVAAAVGRTPLIKLKRASEETGCTILGKAEFMNPGQSVKDRAALFIIQDAVQARHAAARRHGRRGHRRQHRHRPDRRSATRWASARVIVIPETQSQEKKDALRLLGAELVEVPAVPYKNPNNYVHYSRRLAEALAKTEPNGAIWANQLDNVANRQAHIETTAPGDLGRHGRQGRRLRLRGRLGRHAGRRLRRPQGQAQGRSRSRSPTCRARRSTATTRPASSRPRAPPSPRASARAASPRTSRAPWSTAPT